MFLKNRFYISLLSSLLMTSGLSQVVSSMDIEEELVERRPVRTQLSQFINGKLNVSRDNRYFWVRHSFNWLRELYNSASDREERAKAVLGFAHLSAHYPHESFPEMDSLSSTRYSMSRLEELINVEASLDMNPDFKRYRNHARIFWGQLLTYNLKLSATEDEISAAWSFLSEVDDKYTKIGNVYRANLLRHFRYVPSDIKGSPSQEAQINDLIRNLLDTSYSRSRVSQVELLRIDTRDSVETAERSNVSGDIDARPLTLLNSQARQLRARLEVESLSHTSVPSSSDLVATNDSSPLGGNENRKRGRESEENSSSESSMSVESLPGADSTSDDNSRRKRPRRIIIEEAEEEKLSLPLVLAVLPFDHELRDVGNNSSMEIDEEEQLPQRDQSIIPWTEEQTSLLRRLWNEGLKGAGLYTQIWNVMTEEQKKLYESSTSLKFLNSVYNQRRNIHLPVRMTHKTISDHELKEFVMLYKELKKVKANGTIYERMGLSVNRYVAFLKKAKRMGLF